MKIRARRSGSAVLAFVLIMGCAGLSFAQSAKELDYIGMHEADQCSGLKKVCKAASMDKKYKQDCDEITVSLNNSSNRNLTTAYERLESAQPSILLARRYASMVCDYDPALATKKRELIAAIDSKDPSQKKEVQPVDESPAKLADTERLFASGDFDGATTAARLVTDPKLQPRANAILNKIQTYTSAIQEAKRKEGSDMRGSRDSYEIALNINRNGPGDPQGNITRLENILNAPPKPKDDTKHASSGEPPEIKGPAGHPPVPPPPAPDVNAQVALLFAKEKQDEPVRLQEAVKDCKQVQRLQPGNAEAQACLIRLQAIINSDPTEQAKVLADAIRAFYSFRYAEAEDNFTSYLSSTTAKYKGAAHFYLGASRLSRRILEDSGLKAHEAANSEDVQRPFKEARSACYRPVGKYLSPVVLNAWNVSSSSAACPR